MEDMKRNNEVEGILGNPVDYKMLVKYSVDKDMAERLLSKNHVKQRRVRKHVVEEYANDMTTGKWDQSIGSYIALGPDGTLYDGQHRLMAVIQSGATVDMWFDTESCDEQFPYFDNGAKRGVHDYMSDRKNATAVAAIARIAVCAKRGNTPLSSVLGGFIVSKQKPTRQLVLTMVDEDTEAIEDAARDGEQMKRGIGFGGAALYGFLTWFLRWVGDDYRLDAFVEQMGMRTPTSACAFSVQKTLLNNRKLYNTNQKNIFFGALLQAYRSFRMNPDAPISLNKQKHYLDEYDRMLTVKRMMEGSGLTA